ncbi:hypothetical protein [Hyphomicrobium sp. D-2]|uniref:hypothetical protein n=1 Tax=Hyphomicrobium sp. D-2 TaxID=3041621 RepID=UPI002453F521|nr:hypothetical protein [Hyphomicrobium sp. D-2]MDH4983353.1 hypothetical protein [Hyphomicrobium sp. D-2]
MPEKAAKSGAQVLRKFFGLQKRLVRICRAEKLAEIREGSNRPRWHRNGWLGSSDSRTFRDLALFCTPKAKRRNSANGRAKIIKSLKNNYIK